MAIQKALEELKGRRAEVEALKAAVGARDERIKGLVDIIADQDRIIALWKEAAGARGEANAADAKIEASYEASVKQYEAELARVRQERDSARRSRWLWALGGAVVGVLAVFASHGGGN